jgi:trehalose 6-phosphate synthase
MSSVSRAHSQRLRTQIEELVSQIKGHCSLERSELVALYRTADMALITPLKDGMNLIAKEYCAANVDCNGVLILSAFAGAAKQLGPYALLVNPYDMHGVADAIYRAYAMRLRERLMRTSATLKQSVQTPKPYTQQSHRHTT